MRTAPIDRRLLIATLTVGCAIPAGLHAQECNPPGNRYTRSAEIELDKAISADDPRTPEERYQRTLEILQEAFDEGDAPPAAYLFAAQAKLGLREYVAADSLMDIVDQLVPECASVTADARYRAWAQMYNLGIQQFNAGNVDEALASFEKSNLVYEDARSYNNVASIYQNKGEFEKAIAAYEKAYSLAEDEEQKRAAAINRAELLKALGRTEEALALYEEYSRDHPDDLLGRLNYAIALGDAGQVEEASAMFQEFLERDDLTFTQWSEVGIGLYRSALYEQAAVAFGRAHAERPYNKETLENLANSLALADSYEALLPLADTLVSRHPLETSYLRLLANSYVELGQNDKALEVLERRESLTFELLNVTLIAEGEGSYRIQGDVMARTAPVDSEVTLEFDFLDENGQVLFSEPLQLIIPPEGETSAFELGVSSETELAGFAYRAVETASGS